MTTPISPKVLWGTIAGLLATAALTVLQGLAGNADFIDSLPDWAKPLVAAAVAIAVAQLAAYVKTDGLRVVGAQTVALAPDAESGEAEDGFDADTPADR